MYLSVLKFHLVLSKVNKSRKRINTIRGRKILPRWTTSQSCREVFCRSRELLTWSVRCQGHSQRLPGPVSYASRVLSRSAVFSQFTADSRPVTVVVVFGCLFVYYRVAVVWTTLVSLQGKL